MAGSVKTDHRSQVLDEHRDLTDRVTELDQWVAPGAAKEANWAAGLERRVGVVLEHLKMHFAGDAEGSLFAEVSMSAPHLSGRLTTLAAEHSQILKAFQQVADGVKSVGDDDKAQARLALMTQAAIATLRRHEAEENEIIMRAFWEDLGAAD